MNLAHLLLQSALRQPDRPALAVGKKAVLTLRRAGVTRCTACSGLREKLNLRPGDRVALAMKNCPEYYEILFACWHAGLTAVPMNAKLHAKEFAYILENSGAKACFVTPDLQASADADRYLELEKPATRTRSRPRTCGPDDVAWLFYTSGTTGVPKGAMLTHRNMLFQTPGLLRRHRQARRPATRSCTRRRCRTARASTACRTSPPARST